MRSSRKCLALGLGLGLTVGSLAATVTGAAANPGGTGLVINEVYGAGGNSGATFNADYVELYNPTDSAIPLGGLGLQYRSAAGGSAGVAALSGSVPANDTFLVQTTAAGVNGAALTPDLVTSTSLNMSGSAGQVLLLPNTTPYAGAAGDVAGSTALLDMVGFGTTPTTYERAITGVNLTAGTSAQRGADGADTDHNADDFSELAPTPEASGGGTDPDPEPEPEAVTIAEIQGTDAATSPLAGTTVTTTGVVTANYPTGGFNGFFIQTPGTGTGTDATPGAADGLFVYGANVDETTLAVGDHVEVTGPVSEYTQTVSGRTSRLTQITPAAATDVAELPESAAAPQPLVTTWFTTDAEREAHEGELVELTGPLTVTNSYATHQYGEIGLAVGTEPLVAPTEIRDAQTGNPGEVAAENAARLVTLDDGSSRNFAGAARDEEMSWLSPATPVRTGAAATLTGPFVVDHRNGLYKIQPPAMIDGVGADKAIFENTRTAAPENVGGDVRIATFNVLNYFPTTGAEYVASGLGTCTFYNDRAGNPITVNSCTNNGPRGAANQENFERQQAKIVAAINELTASVVSLEEIENSVQFGKDRDFAISKLVEALNADAGAGTWDYVPSPTERPAPAQEDVIRTGFIYKPADVALVGESEILVDEVNFDNAREPLAQAFKGVGSPDSDAFAVIVNHFKSKGSGTDDGTGQGNANPDRIGQAEALSTFADGFAADRGTEAVFLAGDFNSYSMEDPMQVLYDDGYTAVESDTEGEETYVFDGLVGSLDHVLANAAGAAMVTGADIWNINAVEPVGYEYGRYNANVTNLYDATPYRSSDHDPEIVGLDLPDAPVATTVSGTADEIAYGTAGTVDVQVVSDKPVTGTVEVRDGDTVLGSAAVAESGQASVTLPAGSLPVGTHQLTVAYSGDEANEPSTGTVEVEVVKAEPAMDVVTSPERVTTKVRNVELTVSLTAPGQTVTGTVEISWGAGQTRTGTLSGGQVTFDLGAFKKAGDHEVLVSYLGSDTAEAVTTTATVRVFRK